MSPQRLTAILQIVLVSIFPHVSSNSPSTKTKADNQVKDEDINSSHRKSEIFREILEKSNYDVTLRPGGIKNGTGPTEITLSLDVRAIENIDDIRMQYSVQLSYNQEWLDPRLKYSHIQNNINYLHLLLADRIWAPNIFFRNEKQGFLHTLVTPNLYTRIYPNGTVFQSYRISLVLSCPMDLYNFPFDDQTCPLEMASYGWITRDLILKWKQPDEVSVQIPKDLTLPKFTVKKLKIHKECLAVLLTGNISCARVEFVFSRQYGLYVVQIFTPSAMLTVISWVGFFLEPTAVEARVSLGITTSLASLILNFMLNQISPPTSYVTAIDIWLFFCQGMVFGVLMEFALVNYLAPRKSITRKISHIVKFPVMGNMNANDKRDMQREAKYLGNALQRARTADRMARFCFPFVFFVFCLCYWVTFLHIVHK